MGSAALWQGFALRSFELVLARGYGASRSIVELFVRDWGEGFPIQRPSRDEDPPNAAPSDDLAAALEAAAGVGPGDREPPSRASLPWSGWVTVVETENEQTWSVQHGPLYVIDMTEVQRSGDGSISVVRLTLADPRWRHTSGALTRWSFNRRRGDGAFSRDSLHPQNRPWTSSEVLVSAAQDLRGRLPVLRTPNRLEVPAGPVALAPYGPALGAVGDLVSRFGLEQPCLTWGGALEFYEPGEAGGVGDAEHGRTLEQLPPELSLWLQGAGQGHNAEQGWPADYVLVRGEPRLATASVDGWEPVLHLSDGSIVPLDEETLKKLVPGAKPPGGFATWTEWLSVWVLGPRTHRGIPGFKRSVAELLDSQAWRLWRMPGVVRADGAPGRNAHLLPLLPRAEVSEGRGLPILVETFHFGPAHVEFTGTNAKDDAVRNARAQLGAVQKAVVEALFRAKQLFNQGGPQDAIFGPGALSPRATRDLLRGVLDGSGISFEEVAIALSQARYIQRLAAFNADLSREHEKALRGVYVAEEGVREQVFEIGLLISRFEAQLAEGQAVLETGTNADVSALVDQPALAENLRRSVERLAQEARAKLEAMRIEARTGTSTAAPRPLSIDIHENYPREIDVGASVYDADRGLIQTSRLAGHLKNPNVTNPLSTNFVPQHVRVTFGCQVRPRVDLLPGEKPAPLTGSQRPKNAREDVIPTALGDELTWFVRLFGRNAAGGEPDTIPVPQVGSDEWKRLFARANVVIASLQERIPLPVTLASAAEAAVAGQALKGPVELADSPPPVLTPGAALNALQLEQDARAIAAGHLRRRQVIRADRATFARPHKVRLDGVVAEVTIRSRDGFAGCVTEIVTGTSEKALDPMTTRVRPRQGTRGTRDAKAREAVK